MKAAFGFRVADAAWPEASGRCRTPFAIQSGSGRRMALLILIMIRDGPCRADIEARSPDRAQDRRRLKRARHQHLPWEGVPTETRRNSCQVGSRQESRDEVTPVEDTHAE